MSCDIKIPKIDISCDNLGHWKTILMKTTDLKYDKEGNLLGIKRKYGKNKREAYKL
jgi:hypothetical protein